MSNIKDMERLVDTIQKISPREDYSAELIAKLRLIPWATNYRTLVKMFTDGRLGWDKEKVIIVAGKHRRYFVKGSAIKKYLKTYGPVFMDMARQSKHDKRSKNKSARSTRGKGKSL